MTGRGREASRRRMRATWDRSFTEQIAASAYNTSAVEAVIRHVAYYLRGRAPAELRGMSFLEMGCGAGPNLIWLARKGVSVSGIDIARAALALARENLRAAGLSRRVGRLVEGSVTRTPFAGGSFDGVIESCVFQHLDREDRARAFAEVRRLLKPGGLFVGYMLDRGHSVFQKRRAEQLPGDPGTLMLQDGTSKLHLTDIGLSHFFSKEEYAEHFRGFSTVDPCLATYRIPRAEARKRGYDEYMQSMWIVHAVK
jgi:SAM-dependent methyltransferase